MPSHTVMNGPGLTEFVEEYPAPAVTREEEDRRTAGVAFSWECFRVADCPVYRNHVCSHGLIGFRDPIIPKGPILSFIRRKDLSNVFRLILGYRTLIWSPD